MNPNNTTNNLASTNTASNKTNNKNAGTSAATSAANLNTPGFNALFGQAFEKKQVAASLTTNKSNTGIFGDDLRSATVEPSNTNQIKRKQANSTNTDNEFQSNLAQNLVAQQIASTTSWSQTQTTPKQTDQEWQSQSGMQNATQTNSTINKPTNNQENNVANNATNNDANNTSNNAFSNEANKAPNDNANKTAGNTTDSVAQRVNQITQAVVQNDESKLELAEQTNTITPNFTTPQTASTQTPPALTTVQASTESLASNATELDFNLKTNNQNVTTSAPNLGNTTTNNNSLNNAPGLVQQVMAQREVLNSVSKQGLENNIDLENTNNITNSKIAISNNANPSNIISTPSALPLQSNGANNSATVSTRLGTPINQPSFAKELGHTVQWAISKNISTVDIRINPENFGPLNMRIVQKGQEIQLLIRTQDEQSANTLQQALSGLKESLGNQGLQLNQVNIQHGQSNSQTQNQSSTHSNGQGTSSNPNFSQQSKPNNANQTDLQSGEDQTLANTPANNNRASVGGVDLFA